MKITNTFGITLTSLVVLSAFGAANAASGRSVMPQGPNQFRMPTMPVMTINSVGNPAVQNIDLPAAATPSSGSIVPTPTPNPNGKCADGGIKNSEYTVSMCMDDILQCINTGALQGGLNDLFNYDVRNSIMGGMKVCHTFVEKCMSDVRVNCRNVYNAPTDVWLDFNSRIVQPEYYNFVLRKTGLTPNQAENTCLLLDRNTYGSSFAAVSDANVVNTEYNKGVGAYNRAEDGALSKDNPQGVDVNTVGYDGNRGHYARWDAANAECLIRVGAYNKDKAITNSWLFGAVGDDAVAEVWQKAGSSFTCNKDLFGFSLMNTTKTVAVVGVAGGTVLGAAIGAGAGAAVYNKKAAAKEESDDAGDSLNPCANEEYRAKLAKQISTAHKKYVLRTFLYENVEAKQDEQGAFLAEVDESKSNKLFSESTDWYKLNKEQCNAILDLYDKAEMYESAIRSCRAIGTNTKILSQIKTTNKPAYKELDVIEVGGNRIIMSGDYSCGPAGDITKSDVEAFNSQCLFVPLQLGLAVKGPDNPFCNHGSYCLTPDKIEYELSEMRSLLDEIAPAVPKNLKDKKKELSKGKEIGKGLAIGAATGAAAGGLATLITAGIERSSITCHVGDGLNSVALGKSHTIDSLKDFYVKWNLHLPDTVSPTSAVVDRASWEQACAQFNNRLSECPNVQINYKTGNSYEFIQAACVLTGSVCMVNETVAASHGL